MSCKYAPFDCKIRKREYMRSGAAPDDHYDKEKDLK